VAAGIFVWLSAAFLAAGLAVSQFLLGGWWYPTLAAPGYLLVAACAILAGAAFWKTLDAPGALCVGATLLFAGFLFWRQANSPDLYVARDDAWLLLGALCVYLAVAWQMRSDGVRWFLVGTIAVLIVVQAAIVIAQFAAESPFHPLADLALRMRLPRGDEGLVNRGFVSGTLSSRGSLSAVLQAMTFIALGMLVWGRGGAALKMLLLWVTAAGFAAQLLSLSRAGYLGLVAGTVTFALVSFFILNRGASMHRFRLALGALALAVLPLVLAAYVGAESIIVQFRLGEMGGDVFREALWFRTAAPMLALDPWLGAGANMFDQLSLRYRDGAFDVGPVHAHNDWLQLLIEYGLIGLALGVAVFLVHVLAGFKNAMRLAREASLARFWPQSMELGLVSGALAAWMAQGVHSFFDYRLHIAPVALLLGLSGGWLAGARHDQHSRAACILPWWLRCLAIMPLVPGLILFGWVWRDAPAERCVLEAENAFLKGDRSAMAEYVAEGLALDAENPRLLALAGESAIWQRGVDFSRPESGFWAERSSDFWRWSMERRPYQAEAMREYALSLSHRGLLKEALPFHLRAIGLDPDYAKAYEYLGYHYVREGRYPEALRLFNLAARLPGATATPRDDAGIEKLVRPSAP